MPFVAFIHSHGRGSFPVRVEDASIIAVLLKDLVEGKPTAKKMDFAVGDWDIYLCDAAGTKVEPQVALADGADITPAAGEAAVHLWVEPKPGAAAGQTDSHFFWDLGGSLLCSFSPALGLWVRQNPGATQLLGWILFVFWQWIGLIVPPEVALLIWETIGLAVSLALLAKLRLPRQRKLVALAVWFVVFGLRLWRHQPTISQIKFVALSGVGYNNTQPA